NKSVRKGRALERTRYRLADSGRIGIAQSEFCARIEKRIVLAAERASFSGMRCGWGEIEVEPSDAKREHDSIMLCDTADQCDWAGTRAGLRNENQSQCGECD